MIAVEPNPVAYKLLRYNIAINKLEDKVATANIALADYEGETVLHIEDYLMSSSTIVNHWHHTLRHSLKSTVKVTTLDNFLKELHIKNIDLMKVDVEGAELAILKGGAKSLENGIIRRIVMEIHLGLYNIKDLINILKSYGYQVDLFEIRGNTALLYAKLIK